MYTTIRRVRAPFRSVVAAIGLATSLSLVGASAFAQGVVTLETPAPPGAPSSAAPDAAPTPPSDPQEAVLAYVRCMRDHGVDMPDPEFTADGGVIMRAEAREGQGDDAGSGAGPVVGGPADPLFAEAQGACGSLMGGMARDLDPAQEAEAQARALDFARCMRDHGVDMPDPQFDANGGMSISIGGPGSKPVDPDTMQEAQEACNDLMGPPPDATGGDGTSDDGGQGDGGPATQGDGSSEGTVTLP